jgi:hypothetical protein
MNPHHLMTKKLGKFWKHNLSCKFNKKCKKNWENHQTFETTKLIFYKNTGHEPRLGLVIYVVFFSQSPGSYMRDRTS